jgi:hypothetical protein
MMAELPIRFGQWEVTADGMRPVMDPSYLVDKDTLDDTREDRGRVCSDWLLHIAEKEWVDIDDFTIAWLTACRVHRVNIDHIDVAASVKVARWLSGAGRAFKAELDQCPKYALSISDLEKVDRSEGMRAWRKANPRP